MSLASQNQFSALGKSAAAARPLQPIKLNTVSPANKPLLESTNEDSQNPSLDCVNNERVQAMLAEIIKISQKIAKAVEVITANHGDTSKYGFDLSGDQIERMKTLQNPNQSSSPIHGVITDSTKNAPDRILELITKTENRAKGARLAKEETTEQIRIYGGETPGFRIIRRHSHPSGDPSKKECIQINTPKLPFDNESIPKPDEKGIKWKTSAQEDVTPYEVPNIEASIYEVEGGNDPLYVNSFEGQSLEVLVRQFHLRIMSIYTPFEPLIEAAIEDDQAAA